jgi:hypothetical protein
MKLSIYANYIQTFKLKFLNFIQKNIMLPEINEQISKANIQYLANKVVDNVCLTGNIIQLAENLAKMDLLIKEIKENSNYKDYILNEVSKYGKSHITASGTKLEVAEVGTKYDYSLTNDLELKELEEQKAIIDFKIKERQTFLKTIKKPIEVLFGDELITLHPASKTSTTSIKTTISK